MTVLKILTYNIHHHYWTRCNISDNVSINLRNVCYSICVKWDVPQLYLLSKVSNDFISRVQYYYTGISSYHIYESQTHLARL